MHILLLDRDGTITQNGVRPGDYINDPKEIELIPGILERLEDWVDKGWKIALISNQGGVEKGFITMDKCCTGFQKTLRLAPMIERAYFCPEAHPSEGRSLCIVERPNKHHAGEYLIKDFTPVSNNSYWHKFGRWFQTMALMPGRGYVEVFRVPPCRKPNSGMAEYAIGDFVDATPGITSLEVIYVGDRPEDREMVINLNSNLPAPYARFISAEHFLKYSHDELQIPF